MTKDTDARKKSMKQNGRRAPYASDNRNEIIFPWRTLFCWLYIRQSRYSVLFPLFCGIYLPKTYFNWIYILAEMDFKYLWCKTLEIQKQAITIAVKSKK